MFLKSLKKKTKKSFIIHLVLFLIFKQHSINWRSVEETNQMCHQNHSLIATLQKKKKKTIGGKF